MERNIMGCLFASGLQTCDNTSGPAEDLTADIRNIEYIIERVEVGKETGGGFAKM